MLGHSVRLTLDHVGPADGWGPLDRRHVGRRALQCIARYEQCYFGHCVRVQLMYDSSFGDYVGVQLMHDISFITYDQS